MEIPIKLKQKIIDFLVTLPDIHDGDSQRAWLYYAGLDSQLQEQLLFGKPLMQFIPLLVSKSLHYGKLGSGRKPLIRPPVYSSPDSNSD